MAQNQSLGNKLVYSLLKLIFGLKEDKSLDLGSPKSFLIVRQHNQLGDALLSSSIFTAIKENYPDSRITAIYSPQNVIAVSKNKYIDTVINLEKKKLYNPLELIKFVKILRKGYDVAIVPATVSLSFTSSLIARLSKVKYRIGPAILEDKINSTSFMFDKRVNLDWSKTPTKHITERSLDIIAPFGITTDNLAPVISFDENDIDVAKSFLAEIGYNNESKLIGLHIGAGKPPNRWNPENFIKTVKKLSAVCNCTFYLTGSKADEEVIGKFQSLSEVPIPIYTGKTIPQVAALISMSNLFIANDTGIMHVAGATKTPQISIFGPTDPLLWASNGENKYFLRESDNINDVKPESVFTLAYKILFS